MTDVTCKLLRTRESVLRFKNGSPKLKDVLRKKCKERLQKNREDFVDKLRNISEDVDVFNTLTNMIKEDLKSIYSSDITKELKHIPLTLENITDTEEESVDEELEWLMDKYNNIFDDDDRLAGMLDELNEVICPICQKSTLELKTAAVQTVVICKCGLLVPTTMDLYQIKENIMSCLDEHNNACNVNPQFGVVSEDGENHAYLMCYSCSSFQMLL